MAPEVDELDLGFGMFLHGFGAQTVQRLLQMMPPVLAILQ
jgi:hypothetical protein